MITPSTVRIIEVISYDPAWPIKFEKEKSVLSNIIGDNAVNIEHIGSTSVPGLCAKPVIDILIEVTDLDLLDGKNAEMEALDYVAKGENSIPGRRYFQKGGNQRSHQVHAFKTGDQNLIAHRAFKHYLVAHPQIASEYSKVKRQAVDLCQQDIVTYMALKNDFIQKQLKLAIAWYNLKLRQESM